MKNNFKNVDFAAISAYNKRTDKKEVIGVFNGERLRQIRTERGWSQERLGEVIGVSRSAISKIEKGTVPDPKLEQVAKMAEALGVSAEWLSGWTDDRRPAGHVAQNIHDSAVAFGSGAALLVKNGVIHEREVSDEAVELLRIFEGLDVKGRTKLLALAYNLEEKQPRGED